MQRPSAILMISSEPFLLLEEERKVRDRFVPAQERDLNLLTLYGWEASLPSVLDFIQTLPFLGKQRLLVIREVEKFTEWKDLTDYLKDPNPSSVLLMTSADLKKNSAQFKTLSKYCEVREFRKPYGRNLVKWVGKRFEAAGKSIDPELCEILIQIAGEDLGILTTEVEKVVMSSGENSGISREDLSVTVPGGVEVIFNFLDALGDRDQKGALHSLRVLRMNGNPAEYLLHMMTWHYRQLLRGREMVSNGMSPDQAAVRMGKKFAGLKDKFARHLGRATERQIAEALEALSRCDRELKRGRISSEVLLDKLVLELLAG